MHAVGILSPRVVSGQEAVDLIAELSIELEGPRVRGAHFQSDEVAVVLGRDSLCLAHEFGAQPSASGFGNHRDREDAPDLALEEEHHGSQEPGSAILDDGDRVLVREDPPDMLPPESVLLETHGFDSVNRLEVSDVRAAQHAVPRLRPPLCAFRRSGRCAKG